MGKSDSNADVKTDEFTKIFDEYRARIDEITKKTEKTLLFPNEVADTNSNNIEQNMEEITVSRIHDTVTQAAEKQPDQESSYIISEARRKAEQIIEEAEENARKEAKKRTKSQVEKLLKKTQKEAEDIISQARQMAEQERNDIISLSKNQAEVIIKEITEKCRQQTETQSSQIIAEAREKADKMMSEITSGGTEISRLASEMLDHARTSVNDLETKMRTESEALLKAISDTQNTLDQILATSRKTPEIQPAVIASKNTKEEYENPTLAVRLLGEQSNGHNGSQPLFRGQVEMKSVSASFDYQYLKNLKKYLIHIPSIKYLQESASEKETSVLFEIQEPLPLLDILGNIPMVEEITTEDDSICVVFKSDLQDSTAEPAKTEQE
jgi:vacuolar-type H+-ATPase subunit H